MAACLMVTAFFGAAVRRPFFVLAAALCARRALLLLPGFACRPLVVPWTIVVCRFVSSCRKRSISDNVPRGLRLRRPPGNEQIRTDNRL